MHKAIVLVSLLSLAFFLDGCGSNTPGKNNINGNWSATLTNPDGSVAYQFSASFSQGSGSALNVTNLTYATASSCPSLASMNSAGGSFTVTGSSDGWVTGTFTMAEASPAIIGPDLGLQGAVRNDTISGQWTLSSGIGDCTGNGSFTIHPTTAQ